MSELKIEVGLSQYYFLGCTYLLPVTMINIDCTIPRGLAILFHSITYLLLK